MDILTLIEQDHQKVSHLFDQLEEAKDNGTRDQLFTELKEELEVHSHAEEDVFYPALREAQVEDEAVEEAIEDHQLVSQMLQELETTPKDSEDWSEKLQVLKENVEGHVEEEEEALFGQIRQTLDAEQLEELGQRMHKAKQQHMARR